MIDSLIYIFFTGEHLWPRSYGLTKGPSLTDLHNIRPADVNGKKSHCSIFLLVKITISVDITSFSQSIHQGGTSTMVNALLAQANV